MKPVIFAVIAFVVGLAGGTGVGLMRAPKTGPVAVADSTKKDGPAAPAQAHGTGDATQAVTASSSTGILPVFDKAADSSAAPSPARGLGTPPPYPTPSAASAGASGPSMADVQTEDFRQVARILTNMKPTDAAKILSFLNDDLVEGIIRSLGPRQAAVLLVQLPPQRAAALSRKLIQNPTAGAR